MTAGRHKNREAAFLRIAASSIFMWIFCFTFADAQSRRPANNYDGKWYLSEFWTGEYPSGFSVIDRNVSIKGRSRLNFSAARHVKCELPYLAVIHPWNAARIK